MATVTPVKKEKVVYGLRNVHYAILDDSVPGAPVYSVPKPLPGNVNLGLTQSGETVEFYADNISYWSTAINNGYEGTYEGATVTDEFKVEVLGEVLGADGVLYEDAKAKAKHFALLAEFDTDLLPKRICMYNCVCDRPQVGGKTKTNTTEPQTATLNLKARPVEVGERSLVKASTTQGTAPEVYSEWHKKVRLPDDGTPEVST